MPRRFALRDKPLPHMNGKRQVRQSVAMQVAKFPAAHPELDPSESVCSDRDTGPAGHLPDDLVFDALGHVSVGTSIYQQASPRLDSPI